MHFGASMTMGNLETTICINKAFPLQTIQLLGYLHGYGKLHILGAASFRKLKPGDVLLEVAGKPCLNFVLLG